MENTIGHWLKRRRKALGLSQVVLGRMCNCSAATIRKIEADLRRPSQALAEQLAKHLHITSARRDTFLKDLRAPHSAGTPVKPVDSQYLGRTNVSQAPLAMFGGQNLINSVRRQIVNYGCRLLTLTGLPGVGKTSLALHAAWEMLEDFEDGVYFIPLDDVETTDGMCARTAKALGLDDRQWPAWSCHRLSTHLRDKHILLVLDNVEQITRCGPAIAELLNECAWVHVLATSRVPLNVRRERQQPVPLLPAPEAHEPPLNFDAMIRRYPALELFVDHASAVNPDLDWSPSELNAAGAVCRLLDGLPLAIELIAAKCRVFTPQQLLGLLEQDNNREGSPSTVLDLAEGGASDLPDRQQSLRKVFDSSYALISSEEQRLFRYLSVFQGEFSEDVIRTFDRDRALVSNALTTLNRLVAKNLVRMRQVANDGRVFSMLNVVRAFAHEKLVDQGEMFEAHNWHASIFLDMALKAERHLFNGTYQVWLVQLKRYNNDLCAALDWNGAAGNRTEAVLQLAGSLVPYWLHLQHMDEGRHRLAGLLQNLSPELTSSTALPKVHNGLAHIAFIQGDTALAKEHYPVGLRLARQHADDCAILSAQSGLALLAVVEGEFATARQLASANKEIGERLKNQWFVGLSYWALGEAALGQGENEEGRRHLARSIELLSEVGDQLCLSVVMERLGHAELDSEQHTAARTHLKRSLEISRAHGFHGVLAGSLEQLAASMASTTQDYDSATQLFSAASALRNAYRIPPQAIEQPYLERTLSLTKAKLGEQRFNEIWNAGLSMSLDEACAYAIAH